MEEKLMYNNENIKETKFCKECGQRIDRNAVFCMHCGCMVENIQQQQPQVAIYNSNQNLNTIVGMGRKRSKWAAFCLCAFLGWFGAHKFYEGKAGAGIAYACTLGLFGIGWFIDCLVLLGKPDPYYVY